jgi:hypothetical protein
VFNITIEDENNNLALDHSSEFHVKSKWQTKIKTPKFQHTNGKSGA